MTYQPPLPEMQAVIQTTAGRTRPGAYPGGGKRLLDVVLAALLIVPVGAVVALLAAIVALDGANPFFGHRRMGRHGRMFRCWKLRSMVPDAEQRLARHLAEDPAAAREWAETQKLTRDPRVTAIGRLLRKTSLDELPQLWNVLRGEMSLVGPRPVTAEEMVRYGRARWAYLSVRPGITGPWQVLGRNRLSYAERVRLDADYAREVSLALDVGLMLRTVPVVLRLTGR